MKQKSIAENISDSNHIKVELLITDAKTALTLLDLAETTRVAEDRSRRIRQALRAYQSILSFLTRLSPSVAQAETLHQNLETIKNRLRLASVPID
jgi:hypothetical protein